MERVSGTETARTRFAGADSLNRKGEIALPNGEGDAVKVMEMEEENIKECVKDAQRERVLVTRRGKPVGLLVGVAGMDLEPIALGHSDAFWQFIRERRGQKTMSGAELEKQLAEQSMG